MDRYKYYTHEIIYKLMPKIENDKNKMFHEVYPEIEKKIWQAIDQKNTRRLAFIYNELTKLIDQEEVKNEDIV